MRRRFVLTAGLALPAVRFGFAGASSLPPGQSLGLASVPNLRDIGGYPAANGAVVREGVAFRSEKLNPVAPADKPKLAALGLGQVFDLRTTAERARQPDELPPGVREVWLNVLGDGSLGLPSNLMLLLREPKAANAALGGHKMDAFIANIYVDFVSSPSARHAYGALFTQLANGTAPQLYHCTAGKDRTGWATAALLTLLGVDKALIYQDYLKTNDYILPEYQPMMAKFEAGGGQAEIIEAVFAAKPDYLDIAFAEMSRRYGSVQGYFTHGLGVGPAAQAQLKARFLTAA